MTDGERARKLYENARDRMFRLEITLGSIIELFTRGEGLYEADPIYLRLGTAVNALCRIQGLDPHELHQKYLDWQNGMSYVEGEGNE